MTFYSYSMTVHRKTSFSLYFWLCIIPLFSLILQDPATAQDFPRYAAIEKNVVFWEKIYSTYSLDQAVIHDSKDLSKIYEVIDLLNQPTDNAAKLNKKAQKQTIKKYQKLLKKLSKQRPVTREEKRIAALYTGKYRSRDMGRAAERVRSQKGQRERFKEGVIRSGKYLPEIKRILRSNYLPEDLAYLPHVESSFNTKAYSKFGAAGIWQFTRATGKRYLQIDYSVDERLDPILASHAAAKYLKNSYRNLASWPLALTSYNYGLPGMIRAQEELGSYQKIFTDYNKGYFKFASRNFYSEFLAARKVAKNLEKKIKTDPPEKVSYLKLKGYASLSGLSRHFKVSTQTLHSLNPAFRPAIVKGEKLIPKGYNIRLPKNAGTQKLITNVPSSLYKKGQKATQFHRVQRGETAGSIAKRYGVSLKTLMKANNLDGFATIFIKQNLRIPKAPTIRSGKSKKDYSSFRNTYTTPTLIADKKNKPTGQKIHVFPAQDPTVYNVFNIHRKNGKTLGYITVQPEESIRLYADLLKTSRQELLKLNSLGPHVSVTPGMQLLLQFDALKPTTFEEKRLDFLQETEDDFFAAFSVIGQKSYTVSTGDTLWDLCYNKFEIPLWLLERYNSTINLLRLSRSQELVIPIVQQI
ncbi:MAG: membrane-bound lytic murein transglycosylase D [Desulforhopalus sp.]|jgi:membrane-bound lytic murein transglycosylase D